MQNKLTTLFKTPLRFLAYSSLQVAYRLRLNHVPVLPTTLDIEPNNWCNFRCDHCQVTHWDKPKAQLDLNRFTEITKLFPNLLSVKVQGMGEPFLNKSMLDLLEYLDKKGIVTNTISNGSVLTEKLIARLSKLKHMSIGFSLDGGTKGTFEGIRIRGNFDKVTDNVKRLVDASPNLDTKFWVVVSKENYHECEEIVHLADRLGVPEVTFQTFITNWGKEDMEEIISDKTISGSDLDTHISNAKDVGEERTIQVNHYKGNDFTAEKPCKWPWTSMMIDSTGSVIPCCVIADAETLNFGNVFEQKIDKIWNSKEYKEFRRQHKDGDIPEICKACYRQ